MDHRKLHWSYEAQGIHIWVLIDIYMYTPTKKIDRGGPLGIDIKYRNYLEKGVKTGINYLYLLFIVGVGCTGQTK